MICLLQHRYGVRLHPLLWSPPLTLLLFLMMSGQAAAVDLLKVEPSSSAGGQVSIQLTLSEPVPAPATFSTESPARIALDFPGVTSKLENRSIPIGVGPVHSLVAVDASNRTRVVLNLTDSVPYAVKTEGNRVIITVSPQGTAASAPTQTITVPPASAAAPWKPATRASQSAAAGAPVRDIDFRRGTSGEGRVVIRLPNANTKVAVRAQGSRVFVDLTDTSLPQRLFRRLDVTDFATPVTAIESRPNGRNVEIEIQMEGDFDYMAYQTDEVFTLDFRPLTPAEKEEIARNKVVYEGDRLSLNFQDIEVRAVLQVLADFTNMNLVASDSVQGNITLRLKNVPWDQALDIILKTKGLAMRQTGNIIMVAPAAELAAQEQLQMESNQKIEELAPLRTEYIQINYAKASEIAAFLSGGSIRQASTSTTSRSNAPAGAGGVGGISKNVSSKEGDINKGSILTPGRGSATFDERTNTLVVMDTVARIEDIIKIVARLDVPVRQVMIESRVVIANNNFARDLGVRFGVSGSTGSQDGNQLLVAGSQKGTIPAVTENSGPFGLNADTANAISGLVAVADTSSSLVSGGAAQSLITNLGAANPSGSVNFLIGKIGSYLLQLELSAMQREGRGELISSPRVITSDQSQAIIKVGQQIPYREATGQGNATTSFKDAVLQLDVTPHITPDDRIIMDLKVNKDAPGTPYTAGDPPPIDTRSIETKVLVENGETVVLGGVFERQTSFDKEQVPWLGDVPVLGRLFKKESRQDNNSELLIFVTPKILKGKEMVSH